ncbi:[acyl-carrier-protein] S-malonyltransferase [Tamaricihabitans halophyticus]|uniref:[acyl-carrier-protein] S-malonyltransferase n=2 Tax=Tamaricihabitans halophyticus TaxID=1262583 RepID=A0A4R2QXS0_9PSEU|nr:[acyl-carrier-protein] S-malonyltransferase [Tamaricihabitans halophyticus]
MLTPWLELDGAEAKLRHWSEAAGLDLVRLGTTAEAEEITDTSVTQPLVVAASLLAFDELAARYPIAEDVPVAGHSVGELAAAAVAGSLSAADAVRLAGIRGSQMAAACATEPTGMSAVLGGDPEQVHQRLGELGLDAANVNGAGQVVAAGPISALAELTSEPPERAKVRSLQVAGAFHTRFMAPAEETLREYAKNIEVADPKRPLLSNADGELVDTGGELLERLIAQVTKPVRWDACMAKLGELGVTATVELTPAGALTGLVKRELKGTATLALKKPDDLDKVAGLLADQGGAA